MPKKNVLGSRTVILRRLETSPQIAEIASSLRRRGATEKGAEIIFRLVSAIPSDWRAANETWNQAVRRRTILANKLRRLAQDVRNDPDLRAISFSPAAAAYAGIPDDGTVMLTFSDLMVHEANFLEGSEVPRIKIKDGEVISELEFERRTRPKRSVPLRSYALSRIFELLEPYYQTRAPNRQTEIIASVLLKEPIPPGTVSHMRRERRRRYSREK